MKMLKLSSGRETILDDEDYEKLSKYKWHECKGYATRTYWVKENGKRKLKRDFIAREIMGNPKGMHVDHINGNTLDNRKENLRIVTLQQNSWNQSKKKKGASKYKGVTKNGNRWRARIRVDDKLIHLGYFGTQEEAALEYNKAASFYYGEFARLNEVEQREHTNVG
jgi:hypothetical protein